MQPMTLSENPSGMPPRPFTLREMLEILFHDRRRLGVAFGVGLAATLLAALLVPARYESAASLLVRLGHEYVYVAEGSNPNSGATPLFFSRDEALNAETEILVSREVVARAVQQVGLTRLYPALGKGKEEQGRPRMDQAVERFRKAFNAELVKDSTVLRLSFSHKDPQLAQQGLHALVVSYLDARRRVFSDAHVRFLDGQVREAGRRLAVAEERLAGFKREHGIVNYEQQLQLLLQQGNDLEIRLNDSSQQSATARARAEKLKQLAGRTPANLVVYTETLGDPQSPRELLQLRLKEQSLSARYREKNPLVRNAREEVNTAERFIEEQKRDPPRNVRTARNQVLDQAELDLLRAASDESAVDGGRKALEGRLDALRARAELLAEQQARLNALEMEQELLEENYTTYARKLESARIDEAREQKERTNVSVLQDADRPLTAKSLRRPILLVGLIGSIGLALLVALVSEVLRTGFQLPVQLERKLRVPVLASLPDLER